MKNFQIMRFIVIVVLALDLFLVLSMLIGPKCSSGASVEFIMPGITIAYSNIRGFSFERFNPVVFFPIILALFFLVWGLFRLSATQGKHYKHMLIWLGLGIGVLILIVVSMTHSVPRLGTAKRAVTLALIEKLEHAIARFAEDCGHAPTMQEGLNALQTSPGTSRWRGPYYALPIIPSRIPSRPLSSIDPIPLDSWGKDFRYTNINGNFKVVSSGPDAIFDTPDDIIRKTR